MQSDSIYSYKEARKKMLAYERTTTSWGSQAIYKELAITTEHDKNDEGIPMDVDRVKGKGQGKRTKVANPKASRRGKAMALTPMWITRASANSRKGRMAKAKMPKERAKVYLQTPMSSVEAMAIGARSVQ